MGGEKEEGEGEKKKRITKLTTRKGGWQHSTNHERACEELQPMGEQKAREQCVLAGRLEETGCVVVGGRGHRSQQCQGKPDELPSAKLGERSFQCMLHSWAVGIISRKSHITLIWSLNTMYVLENGKSDSF